MQYFIHIANVLYVVSFLVRDILWLRIMTVIAMATLVPYYVVNGLYVPIAWQSLFIAINAVQIAVLVVERQPVRLSDEQQAIYRLAFPSLTPRDFLRLEAIGRDVRASDGDVLVEQGRVFEQLVVVVDGTIAVECDGVRVTDLGPGHFVGEMSFLTGAETSARARVVGGARYLAFPKAELQALLKSRPTLEGALQLLIGNELARKLRRPRPGG